MSGRPGTAPPDPAGRPGPARTLVLVWVCGLLCGLTLTVVGALETRLVRDLSLSHGAAGLSQSAFFAGSLLGSLLSGWLLYATQARAFGVGSLCLLAAGNLLSSTPLYLTLLAGRLLAGLGLSGTIVFISDLLVRRFEARQSALFNLLHCAIAAGAVGSMIGARPVADAMGSWAGPLWVLAMVGLAPLLLLGMLPALPSARDTARPPGMGDVHGMNRAPRVAGTFLLMVGYMIAEQGTTTFFAAYMEQGRGLAASTSVRLAALFWFGLGVGRLVSSLISGRLSDRKQLLLWTPAGLCLLLTSLVITVPGGTQACIFLSGVLLGPVIPLAISHTVRQVKEHKGSVVAAGTAVSGLGGALGPGTIGLLADSLGLRFGLVIGYLLGAGSLLPLILQGSGGED